MLNATINIVPGKPIAFKWLSLKLSPQFGENGRPMELTWTVLDKDEAGKRFDVASDWEALIFPAHTCETRDSTDALHLSAASATPMSLLAYQCCFSHATSWPVHVLMSGGTTDAMRKSKHSIQQNFTDESKAKETLLADFQLRFADDSKESPSVLYVNEACFKLLSEEFAEFIDKNKDVKHWDMDEMDLKRADVLTFLQSAFPPYTPVAMDNFHAIIRCASALKATLLLRVCKKHILEVPPHTIKDFKVWIEQSQALFKDDELRSACEKILGQASHRVLYTLIVAKEWVDGLKPEVETCLLDAASHALEKAQLVAD